MNNKQTNEMNKNIKHIVFHCNSYDDTNEPVVIKKPILKAAGAFDIISDLKDYYFYIFHKNIFALLKKEKVQKFNLMRSELIPFLINNAYHNKIKIYNPRNNNIHINVENNEVKVDKPSENRICLEKEKEKKVRRTLLTSF